MAKREINPQQKMDKVIRSARTLFVSRGYHNVSIPQIVDDSGVSIGAIYHHFGNKEGLARNVHEQTLEQFQIWLEDALRDCHSVRQKLRAFSRLVLKTTEHDPEMMEYMLLIKHGEFLTDVPPICSTEPFTRIQEIIAEGIARGELRKGDCLLAAIAFTGVITRAVELHLSGVLGRQLTDIESNLFDYAWASIAA
ncbi:MAG: hypothetical protein Tsb0017_12450 [Geothermobacteraceae bacterium]